MFSLWLANVICLWILFLMIARRTHPQLALGIVLPLAWLAPVWVQWTLFRSTSDTIVGTGIDTKLGASILMLVSYCFFKRATYPLRFAPCDYAMSGLIGIHLISDVYQQGFQWIILGHIYAEWWAPYVIGRLAFQYRCDVSRIWPVVVAVTMVLGCLSAAEMLTGQSLYELFAGTIPKEGRLDVATRWGMRRAYGPTLNPIYFGCLQLLLLGWCGYAAWRAMTDRAHWAWLFSPLPALIGIVASGSRAPILGVGLAISSLVFLRFRQARVSLILLAVLVGAIVYTQQEAIIEGLERWAGEDQFYRADERVIVDDGESKQYSTTRYRLLLLDVYRIALSRAGLLGFGTDAVMGFPVQVPVGPQDVETLRKLWVIDNTYVLLTLRFGYLGLSCWLLAFFAAIYQLTYLNVRWRGESVGMLAACLAAVLVAMLPVMFTVWMPQDYSFALLWTWGTSSGMYLAYRGGTFNEAPPR